ncbi:unnamed protein product, partial [Rotaria magnacalcarata]
QVVVQQPPVSVILASHKTPVNVSPPIPSPSASTPVPVASSTNPPSTNATANGT